VSWPEAASDIVHWLVGGVVVVAVLYVFKRLLD